MAGYTPAKFAKKVVKDFKKADGKNDAKLLKSVLKKDIKKKK